MHFNSDDEVDELVRAFETCDLHPAEFKHYQHLAVALWYVTHFPYAEASAKMCGGIRRLAAAYGKTGYHETITLFWLKAVRGFFVTADGSAPVFELANKLASKLGNKDLIGIYYSEEKLASPEAKIGWVEPDLKALELDGCED